MGAGQAERRHGCGFLCHRHSRLRRRLGLPIAASVVLAPGALLDAILKAPVATLPTRYESRAQCAANTARALQYNNDFDFPSLLAECRSGVAPAAQRTDALVVLPADARRG